MFTSRFNLIRHFGKKCDKKFAHKSNHVNHRETHTKAEAYSRTNTPGEFSKLNALSSHYDPCTGGKLGVFERHLLTRVSRHFEFFTTAWRSAVNMGRDAVNQSQINWY
jgi:hypothetical protein